MNKGDKAHHWAQEIFDLSTKCLMAHSIRAVEQFIEEKLDNPAFRLPHRIKIIESDTINRYVAKRALAFIHYLAWHHIVDDGAG